MLSQHTHRCKRIYMPCPSLLARRTLKIYSEPFSVVQTKHNIVSIVDFLWGSPKQKRGLQGPEEVEKQHFCSWGPLSNRKTHVRGDCWQKVLPVPNWRQRLEQRQEAASSGFVRDQLAHPTEAVTQGWALLSPPLAFYEESHQNGRSPYRPKTCPTGLGEQQQWLSVLFQGGLWREQRIQEKLWRENVKTETHFWGEISNLGSKLPDNTEALVQRKCSSGFRLHRFPPYYYFLS